MILVAIKMLIGDRVKYIALVAGVAFAALLITQQAAIFTGYALRMGAWVRDTSSADLWVMDEQVEHTEDFKPMLDTALQRVRGVEGVEWAAPMFKGFVNAVMPDGTRQNVRVIGIDDATLAGGPPEMSQGEVADLRTDRGVLINAAAKISLDRFDNPRLLTVGDRMSLNDNEAVIVGSYHASPEFFWEPVFYTTYSRARTFDTSQRKTLTYMIVKVKPGLDVNAVRERIESSTGLAALTNLQFDQRSTWWIMNATGILVNFGITITLGVVIGLLVAGQTFYTFVLDNLRNFASLKAMGVSNPRMVGMMVVQVTVVTLIGYGLGLGGAALTGSAFASAGLAFAMPWQIPLLGLTAVLISCVLAGGLSMLRVLRLEPGIVFR